MSSIFDGTEPPRWLEAIAKPADAKSIEGLGTDVGVALGAGFLAMQPDTEAKPNADGSQPKKGFKRGIYEARRNLTDPDWMVKTEELKANASGKWASAASKWQEFNTTAKDDATFATEEIPKITKYTEELRTNPNAVPPLVTTPKGQAALGQINQYLLRKATIDNQKQVAEDRIKNSASQQKFKQGWEDAFTELSPDEQLEVERFSGPDNFRDPQGGLTIDARTKIQDLRKARGLSAVGTAPSVQAAEVRGKTGKELEVQKEQGRSAMEDKRQQGQAALEAQRQTGRKDLEGLRAKDKLKYEEERQKNRKGLLADASKYKIDLAKIVSELKITGKDGKLVGKTDFVNRHFNSVFNAIVKDTGKAADASKQAISILEGSYDSFTPSVKETAPKAQGQGTAAPAKPSATTTKEKDPLGLFEK